MSTSIRSTVLLCPFDATALASRLAGSPAVWRLIGNRPSHRLWHVGGPKASVAVKVAGGENPALALVRESAALDAMPAGNIRPLGSGANLRPAAPLAWQITPWAGLTTWEALRPLREGAEEGREQALAAAVATCRAVGHLHAAGWTHGNLAPHHVVHPTDRGPARLLSCTWATRADKPTSAGYDGGLVHLLSPELAAEMERSRGSAVLVDRSSEVYTLAAGLWWAATGSWPLAYHAYRKAGFDPNTQSRSRLQRAIASGDIPITAPASYSCPEVLAPLAAAMSFVPNRRPTAHQLADWLNNSIPSRHYGDS
ncbi:hypothetical protein ACFCY8_13250 [Streptomyces noursei]|uniref:hypothetical protein n=1 Tax=Streptomyces noursei TaxID=1971 RepID=UPI0035D807F3